MTQEEWIELTYEAIVRFGVEGAAPQFAGGDHRVGFTVFHDVKKQQIVWIAAVPPSSVGVMEDYAHSRGLEVIAGDIHIGNVDGSRGEWPRTRESFDESATRLLSGKMMHISLLPWLEEARRVVYEALDHGWRWQLATLPSQEKEA